MRAPTSAVLAEIYIQNMEHAQIFNILKNQKIIGYFRYVDNMIVEFNKLQRTINFTIEKENHRSINFLDIGIYREMEKLQFSIHRTHCNGHNNTK
ncbi:hypothetical protein B7P43_G06513 [Cryptotermes secundus]|uniref:Reverse transcriptase domain-containing protein n=1 Tax=Cryptotermes secundus TaxID=105785 RepID=A0A2J7Q4J4_9NEOP|nr:hypothetical protein B7P43_G06513 [Cryptotermes secundus]